MSKNISNIQSRAKAFHYSADTLKIKTERKGFGLLKTACILLVIILQIALFVLTNLYLQQFFQWFTLLSVILSLVTCLFVLIDDKNSQSKPMWIIFLILCSSFGFIVYLISNEKVFFHKHGKKYKKILNKSYAFTNFNEVSNQCPELNNAVKYLYTTGKFTAFSDTIGTYFSNGAEFFDSVIEQIKSATSFIFIEFFIISDGYLLSRIIELLKEKVLSGVDVRIIYDDLGSHGTLKRKTIKQIKKAGIKIYPFNKLLSKFSVFLNYRDHRKYVIIDGIVGYTGGANLADEYVGEKKLHGYWKDSGIRLEGPAVDGFTLSFLRQWCFVTKTSCDFSKFINIATKNQSSSIYIPFADGLEYKENIGRNTYINLISSAKEKLYIFTPYFVIDDTVADLIETKAKSGVDVKIILPEVADKKLVYVITRSNAEKLYKSGVKVYFMKHSFVHSKVLINENYAVIGSINMDLRSFYQQFESAVLTNDKKVMQEIERDFDDCINKSEELSDEKLLTRKFVFNLSTLLLNLFSPFM